MCDVEHEESSHLHRVLLYITLADMIVAAGATYVPFRATHEDAGAFPNGTIRFRSAVTGVGNENQKLDLLVTVPRSPTFYSSNVNVAYTAPTSFSVSQALLVQTGFACLGIKLGTAVDQANDRQFPSVCR